MIDFSDLDRILRRSRRLGIAIGALLSLAGCATLPSSGPTGRQITGSVGQQATGPDMRLVEVKNLTDVPAQPPFPEVFAPDYVPRPTNLIAPSDVLDIVIYESGISLFGGSSASLPGATITADVGSKAERLPPLRVDDAGNISLPYLGRVRAEGRTTTELAATIRAAYKGMSQNPQVVVSQRDVVGNSVMISGDVARPGRLVLVTNQEYLTDAIALAGGYRGEAKDVALRVQRNGQSVELRLSDVLADTSRDMRVFAGDRISVVRAPRNFSVMGAPGRVEQLPFSGPSISLSEAIATAGGVNPNLGDPEAIFVFRFQQKPDKTEEPVIYHIDMTKPGSFFIAQRFAMLDKDILYVGNARANQPSKLIQIVSQLFAPIVTVRDIARSTGN